MEIVLNSKFSSVNSLFIYKLAFTSETTSDVDLLVNCSLFTSVHILLYLKKKIPKKQQSQHHSNLFSHEYQGQKHLLMSSSSISYPTKTPNPMSDYLLQQLQILHLQFFFINSLYSFILCLFCKMPQKLNFASCELSCRLRN